MSWQEEDQDEARGDSGAEREDNVEFSEHGSRLSLHRLHDLRLPYSWQTLLHPGPHERGRPSLSSVTGKIFFDSGERELISAVFSARSVQWKRDEILCCWSDPGLGAHAQTLYSVSWFEAGQHFVGRAWSCQNIRPRTGLWLQVRQSFQNSWVLLLVNISWFIST